MSRLDRAACDVAYPHLAHDWRAPAGWSRCPGIRIDPMTRANAVTTRRHVVAELRSIKGMIGLKISRWAISGVEYDGNRLVPRRVDEFPENSVDAWQALARTCRDSIADLQALQTYALAKARAVELHERRAAEFLRAKS